MIGKVLRRVFKSQSIAGTVLLVDFFFLVPYSAIQIVSFLHLSSVIVDPSGTATVRWVLQVRITSCKQC